LDGERIDRPLRRRVILSPPPFEGIQRKSLRRESVLIIGEFSRNYENSSGKKHDKPTNPTTQDFMEETGDKSAQR
jgi:hypothetical protein